MNTAQKGQVLKAPAFVAKGAVPQAIATGKATPLQPLAAAQPMRFTVVLLPPRRAELAQLVRQIQDPHSPNYRKFLSFEQWKSGYAPPDANVAAVERWAQGAGLTEVHRFESNHALIFQGSAATVQKALQITLSQYQMEGHTYFANDKAPVVPLAVAPFIAQILGLDSFQVTHPAGQKGAQAIPEATALPRVPEGDYLVRSSLAKGDGMRGAKPAASGPAPLRPEINGYGIQPQDLWSEAVYNYNGLAQYSHCCNPNHVAGGAPETTIAIIGEDKPYPSDIDAFQKIYPMLATNIDMVAIDGPNFNTPEALEMTLDSEYTTATSNSFGASADTAHIILYASGGNESANLLNAWEAALSDNKARVATSSFGGFEDDYYPPGIGSFTDVTNAMTAQGWTIVAASGDLGGYADCSNLTVQYPASDPNVIGIGGTSLVFGGGVWSEGTWTGNACQSGGGAASPGGGGGGGCSDTFFAPWWQQGVAGCANGRRAVPDFSFNGAKSQEMVYNGVATTGAGTSIGAPEAAGFFAQVNSYQIFLSQQGILCGFQHNTPCGLIGNPGAALYFAPTLVQHSPFYDIRDGLCTNTFPGPGWCSSQGYDKATGLGSADLLQLAWAINFYHNSPGSRAPTVAFQGPDINRWYATPQRVSFTVQRGTMGVAGYSAQWDNDPGFLPGYDAPPPRGNPFWDGPRNPLATTGSVTLDLSVPGCHTLFVRTWDHDGQESPAATFGPLCVGLVSECTIKYSCPEPIYAPPDYAVSCPTVSDFYESAPDETRSFLSTGLTITGGTIDYEVGLLACEPGSTDCVEFSIDKPVNEWCAAPPKPTPPVDPKKFCRACTASGGTCIKTVKSYVCD
jgi:hypothetical protein